MDKSEDVIEAKVLPVPIKAEIAKAKIVADSDNPQLPSEVEQFKKEPLLTPYTQLTESQWLGALHATEVADMRQQIRLRPFFAFGVFILLLIQNFGVWFIIVWAIQSKELSQLQLIFSTLIAGTLTQSYLILRFITNKIFSDIDYHNESDKVKK